MTAIASPARRPTIDGPADAPATAPFVYRRPALAHDLSQNALTVAAKRYLIKDERGQAVETPEEMVWRVALTIATADLAYGATPAEVQALAERFYGMIVQRRWFPNSPTLMNAGRPLGQLSACFVLPVEDTIANGTDGIYDTLRSMALVHQSGGGTGFSFSRLRPKGSMVRSTTGVASGPISFMSLYDGSTEVVKQGGTRRGANMGILRIDHPDVLDFIACKEDTTKITNFNISVAVTDAFMAAVDAGMAYDLIDPKNGRTVGQLDAREVFEKIVRNAWNTGEPGVFFVDEANRYNPVPHLGRYEATNPCGEQALLPFDVCNLGSINLGRFVQADVPASAPWRERIDWEGMRATVHLSTHFLDNVIDANRYPLEQITDLARRIRRIGNGVMGWADLLIHLGVPYDAPEALVVAEAVAGFFDEECKVASERLAVTRGVFPEWERSIWGPDATCARDGQGRRVRPMRRLRNCNVTTVAPTGTISIFADCSSGIEPLFAVAFMRNQAGALMPDVNKAFVALAQAEGWYSDTLMATIAQAGAIQQAGVPARVQALFATANVISPSAHIRMQAAWQAATDSAISKTINFAQDATVAQVREAYVLAHQLRCKGVTVYRDGSRAGQVLSTGATAHAAAPSVDPAKLEALEGELARLRGEVFSLQQQAAAKAHRVVRDRPDMLHGQTRAIDTPLGKMFVTINVDDQGDVFEIFGNLGKAGAAVQADVEAMCRLASLGLRSGIPVREIFKQLRGISSDKAIGFGANKVLSVPDAIAQVIERVLTDRQGIQQELALPGLAPLQLERPVDVDAHLESDQCEECHSVGSLERGDGCLKCAACGWSKCK